MKPKKNSNTERASILVNRIVRPSYVIRLNADGYYAGNRPYTAVPREEATVLSSMKDARRQLNRLQGRLMKDGQSSIEPNVKLTDGGEKTRSTE
jgi:hypothetical protein